MVDYSDLATENIQTYSNTLLRKSFDIFGLAAFLVQSLVSRLDDSYRHFCCCLPWLDDLPAPTTACRQRGRWTLVPWCQSVDSDRSRPDMVQHGATWCRSVTDQHRDFRKHVAACLVTNTRQQQMSVRPSTRTRSASAPSLPLEHLGAEAHCNTLRSHLRWTRRDGEI